MNRKLWKVNIPISNWLEEICKKRMCIMNTYHGNRNHDVVMNENSSCQATTSRWTSANTFFRAVPPGAIYRDRITCRKIRFKFQAYMRVHGKET